MKDRSIFSTCPDSEFFGRSSLIDRIVASASDPDRRHPAIILSSRRWAGKTEVLRRVHRELFWTNSRAIPVYYQFKNSPTVEEFAEDYIKEVVKQYLAFTGRDPSMATLQATAGALERLLVDNDQLDLAGFVARHLEARRASDARAALRNAVSLPASLSRLSGVEVYLILDDLDRSGEIGLEARGVTGELSEALTGRPFAASVSASTLPSDMLAGGYVETVELKGLSPGDASQMMAELCRAWGVAFDAEILTLAAERLEGNPMYMKNIVWAAKREGTPLTGLKALAGVYVEAVTTGAISSALRTALKGPLDLRVLRACVRSGGPVTRDRLMERFRLSEEEVSKTLEALASINLVESDLGTVVWKGDTVAGDFIEYVYSTSVKARSPEEAKTWLVRDILKEGFIRTGSRLRAALTEEVFSALRSFDGQSVPGELLRHSSFARKGRVDEKENVSGRTPQPPQSPQPPQLPQAQQAVTLPCITGSFDTAGIEKNETGPRMLIAHGFHNRRYDSTSEVVWLVGVKDSAAPVNMGDVENFSRRAAILVDAFRTARVVKWMVGRDGFSEEASERLERDGVYSTSTEQLRLLKKTIEGAPGAEKRAAGLMPDKEFEVVLPASKKAELVAARAAGEISTEMGFDEEAIGQIKAALVEACINAFEHSKEKSTRVHLRFVASSDRLTVYVSNSGVGFDETLLKSMARDRDSTGLPPKRGWGMELMKGLMDEVRFERLDNGTRIVLVKYLIKRPE